MSEKSEPSGVGATVAEEVKAVAVEIYKDGLKPAVGEVGSTLGRVVRLVLTPVNAALSVGQRAIESLGRRLELKLEHIPPEKLLEAAPATIAGPAVLQYALLGETAEAETLRDMFAELLAASVDRDRVSIVHPAFVTVLSQLTTDEAWMLESFSKPDHGFAIIHARAQSHGLLFDPLRAFTPLGVGVTNESRIPQYLSNLERLGLIKIDYAVSLSDDESQASYVQLDAQMRSTLTVDNDLELVAVRGALELTPFGVDFWKTCVAHRISR